MTFGDKTTNIYCLTKEEHDKILNDSRRKFEKERNFSIKKISKIIQLSS